jgi:hypothetical protein
MTRQLSLPRLADPRYKRPLAAVETAKGLLDLTEDEIGALVDEGQLVAFDIRAPRADRRELRILTSSIAHYAAHSSDPSYLSPITPDQAIATVLAALKHDKPLVTGKEIKRLLNCGRQHVINLVESKTLPQLPGTTYRPGPNGFPLIPRDKFASWLTSRLEGGL